MGPQTRVSNGERVFLIKWILILSFLCLPQSWGELPFWKAKPEVYKKVVEEHRVIVSVTDHSSDKFHLMKLKGGGQIYAPKDFSFKKLTDFKSIFKTSRYIKSIEVDEKNKSLFIQAVAYGFSNSMKVDWTILKDEPAESILSFHVREGIMQGFEWKMVLEPAKNNRSEVGVDGVYKYEKFPLPGFFLQFGLELIFQNMAIDLRTQVEESFSESTKKKGA